MKNSERNLAVIQNFILHLTHCGEHGLDEAFNEFFMITPEQMYQSALEYIENDHVDGKENPED
jgi:hypothetical protein